MLSRMKLINIEQPDISVCTWTGVYCNDKEIIVSIVWTSDVTLIDLQWLPPSLSGLRLKGVQARKFDTRCLSRRLEFIEMDGCTILGPLDFTTLPARLKTLRLPRNRISGTIDLRFLPMSHIDLTYNNVSVVIVDNSKLPERLTKAQFCRYSKNDKLEAIEVNQNSVDRRISLYSWKHGKATDTYGAKMKVIY